MRKISGWNAVRVTLAVALGLILSSEASAEFREFSGEVTEISGEKMVISNRRGDRVSFRRSEVTRVTGAKKRWQAIEAGDRVSVSWKIVDVPRVAYKIVVMPPKQEPRE